MKHALVGSLTALLAGAGLALAQQPDTEILPRPRNVTSPTQEVSADQAGNMTPNVPPPPGPDTPYGPPPSMVAPVCGTQGYPFRLWMEGDYHGWWLKGNNFPPLLVSVPAGGVGAPGTAVLAGGNDLDHPFRNGGGLTLGAWFTDYQGFGIEGSFFVTESSSRGFDIAAPNLPGSPILGRPFFDVLTGQSTAARLSPPLFIGTTPSILAFSGSASGETEGIQCDSGRFVGVNFDFICNICCDATCRYDFLIGYRFLQLDDRFSMTTNGLTSTGTVSRENGAISNIVVTDTTVTDRINAGTRFNGADFGLRGQWFWDRWMLKATAKVAFGASDESTNISGRTNINISGAATNATLGVPNTFGFGFLARPSNSGTFSTEQFAVVPELSLTLAYQVCDWMRVTAGYSFLYWSSVVRSSNQVNLNINPSEVPSLSPNTFVPGQQTTGLHCSDFWAHGVNVGLEIRY